MQILLMLAVIAAVAPFEKVDDFAGGHLVCFMPDNCRLFIRSSF
ncbi:MAG: hypothetical protein ABSA96_20515 [Candidatus Acidiferrales bacterium]|jgi:hypothetical protein